MIRIKQRFEAFKRKHCIDNVNVFLYILFIAALVGFCVAVGFEFYNRLINYYG